MYMRSVIEFLYIVFLFVTYKWIIVFTHELGHYTISRLFGNKSKVRFNMKKNLMPSMYTEINNKKNLKPFEDFLITLGGVLFQVIISVILTCQDICVGLNKISTFYFMPIFLNIIPVKQTDGYHINKILNENIFINRLYLRKIITATQWLIALIVILFIFIDIIKTSIVALKIWNFYLFGLSILGYIIAITSMLCVKNFYNKKSM